MVDLRALADKPTLEGERVRLVPFGPEHVAPFFASLHEPEGRRLTGTHREFALADIEAYAASRATAPDRIDLAILARDTGVFLGELALNDVDPPNESAGFRIALSLDHVGQGYGTEAARLVLRYAFDVVGLHRVELEVFAFNARAIRSYEKAGFVIEGRRRDALLWDGERHDAYVMGALAARTAD